jgi:hypothetical protein
MPEHEFKVGQRVQLSALGRERLSKARAVKGVVVKGGERNTRGPVYVMMDGNKEPSRLHPSYLEPEQ